MRNPFTYTRKKVADTQKAVIDSGIQTAIESTKEKVQNHLKENWQSYAINGAMFASGMAAGAIFQKKPQTIQTNITHNVIHAQTVIVEHR